MQSEQHDIRLNDGTLYRIKSLFGRLRHELMCQLLRKGL